MYYDQNSSTIDYENFVTDSYFLIYNLTTDLSNNDFITSPILHGNYKLTVEFSHPLPIELVLVCYAESRVNLETSLASNNE